MRISSKLAVVVLTSGLALAGVVGIAGPAQAAPGDTVTTFIVTTGSFGITVPGTAALGTVAIGAASVTGSLGAVTVADNRGLVAGTWNVGVLSSTFVSGSTVVPVTNIAYTSGAATTSSTGVFAPAVAFPVAAGLTTAVTWTGVGSSLVTWSPSLTIALPTNLVAGTYTGTFFHSVA
ncbi:MAG: hypothetical protein QOG43_837 [Actinomycetota bacterium]|jgi:hypothetical protein|nr:hypothetical protein [Actinomycetota bacterium]